jgi:transcriptional regulator with XRE-family HTH domain
VPLPLPPGVLLYRSRPTKINTVRGGGLPDGGRDWLASTLRRLREDTGLTGSQAAKLAGISQPKLSRIEAGKFLPKDEDIRTLCKLYRAPADIRRELLQAVADLRPETVHARTVISRGTAKMQERFARIEKASAEVCGYQPTMIPGLLQTPAYARLVFADGGGVADDELDTLVAQRIERGDAIASDRTFRIVMAEGALRWQAGSPEIMIGQLAHLAQIMAARPNVHLGIIPQSRSAAVFPTHAFWLYDRRTVIVGIRTGTSFISDPQDVAEYSKLFGELEELAVLGEDAVAVIQQVAEGYQHALQVVRSRGADRTLPAL